MAGSREKRNSDAGLECSVKREHASNGRERPDSNRNEAVDDRRHLRSRYVALKTLIRGTNDDLDAFTSVITEVDNLHQLVKKPREQVVDAEALLDISNNLVTSVKSQANDGLTPSDFVLRLRLAYGLQSGSVNDTEQSCLRWNDLGSVFGHIFRHFQGSSTMLGPMTNELKQRKVSIQRECSKPAETSQPEALYDKSEEDQTDTDKNMLTMFGILRRRKQVRLESLILSRHSFAQTVENMFALSFLVKDGRVEITVDDKGCHFVSPKNAPSASVVASGNVRYCHFVFRFDFNDWKLMMDMVPFGEELMPNRISSAPADEHIIPTRRNVPIAPCSIPHIQDNPFPVPALDPTVHGNLVVEDSPEREIDSQPSSRLYGFRKLKRKQAYNSLSQ